MSVILKCIKDFSDIHKKHMAKGSTYYCKSDVSEINDLSSSVLLEDIITGYEYVIPLKALFDRFEFFMKGTQHPIDVDDHVYFLKDARKHLGIVTKVNKKTFKVKVCGTQRFTYPESMNIDKEKVAHHNDICTVVCDYKKDPNSMSVRFEYGDDFHETHKMLDSWKCEPASFVSIN